MILKPSGLFAALLLTCIVQTSVADDQPSKDGLDFFETKIRPVLVKECYQCHSAVAVAEGKLKGGLQLDTRAGARTGGDSGPAVVPGKPDESLLVEAIRHESFEMPPKGKLSDSVIADFVKWIEMGAPDPREGGVAAAGRTIDIEAGRQFWSFRPLINVDPPQVDESWVRTDVDRFIRATQAEHELQPNPRAAARTLIRRATFDLIGLPPTPDEVEQFVRDAEADFDAAYAALLDRLLDSPHYGERWARHWMDVTRFAESHGYEQDYDRPHAYHYRDFLIKALNADMPYDQFVRWQLAGDELAPDEPLALMATGFLGAGAFPTQLTEAEFESARYDELDDMVATTGVTFLGLSVGCARCHDHKFDPIPSLDYYRMAATFTTAIRSEIELDLDPVENARRRKEFEAQREQLVAGIKDFEQQQLPTTFRAWLAKYDPVEDPLKTWQVLDGEISADNPQTKYTRQADGSWLAEGNSADQTTITLTSAPISLPRLGSLRIEALTDESLPKQGPGRAGNGNFVLSHIQVATQFGSEDAIDRPLAAARATHEQNDTSLSVAASLDEDPATGWAVDAGGIGSDQAAVFELAEPVSFAEEPVRLIIPMAMRHPNRQHTLGRFRISVSGDPRAAATIGSAGPDPTVIAAIKRLKQAPNEGPDWDFALSWFKTTLPEWQQRQQALADHDAAGPGVELTKVMVTSEGFPHMEHHADGRGFPHFYPETHFLTRGDVHQKGDVVQAGFLQVLLPAEREPADWRLDPPSDWARTSFRRATLANWMTDPEHGAGQLAARVIVNRLWQHHFGRGIVATPNDFGASGERPTHPELLDWLAGRLIDEGWRLKPIHRLLMTSSVYLQSSEFDEERNAIDPDNRLHWRRTPRRLEAEAIRDAMLAVSGQLDSTMYGPGTLDQTMRRRSVYFFIKRSQLIPMMMLFDWPEHLVSIGQRASTTIAPQALMFLNSPQGRVYAEAFAARLPDDPAHAIDEAYRLAFGRSAEPREIELATAFLAEQASLYEAAGHADGVHRARVDLCQAIFGMNEFVYVE